MTPVTPTTAIIGKNIFEYAIPFSFLIVNDKSETVSSSLSTLLVPSISSSPSYKEDDPSFEENEEEILKETNARLNKIYNIN